MSETAAAQWVARGRQHQWQGRPVDAMLCFRRALREAPRAVDARYHLGEVLWQLGRLDEAAACWNDATAVAPSHAAAWQALAEARLGLGDAAGAREAARRLAALQPGDARVASVAAIAGLAIGDDAGAAAAVADALTREPPLLGVPAIAGSLALALDRSAAGDRGRVVDAVIGVRADRARVERMPALLVAQVCERLREVGAADPQTRDGWVAATHARPWALDDHDALRRAALALRELAPQQASELASHYALLCDRGVRAAAPLVWPRRAGGHRLRVIVLAPADAGDAGDAAHALRERLAGDAFEVTAAVVGGTDRSPDAAPDAAAIALPARPDPGEARRLALLDADVLVDLVGLCMSVGALLAQRPARLVVAVDAVGFANRPPLVDAVVPDVGALVAALAEMQASLGTTTQMPERAALRALWSDAVDAHRRGDTAAARAGYERLLALQPEFAAAAFLLGNLLRDAGALEDARARYAAALAAAPAYVDARVAAVRAAVDAGDAEAAVALAAQGAALADDPPAVLLRAFGSACLAAGDGERAAALFEAALAREPVDGETHYNHGVALQMQRRLADAARAYQRALTFLPDLAAADFNLGVIFTEQGNRDAAVEAFRRAVEHNPRHAAAWKNLGEALFAAGRIEAWLANFRRFEAQCPGTLPLAVHALEVCRWSGDFECVEQYLDGLRSERFTAAGERELVDALEELLYLLLFFDVEPELVHRFAQTYDRAARGVYGEPDARPATRRPGRLRIGYLSADLRNHVMGKMVWQAVQHHDRARFALHFYALSDAHDEWTARFESIADRFEVLAGVPERAAAARIAAADLDILVDLSTHTKGARPGILALKPARVQITHVASAGSLGLSTVDFKLTDRYADVPENQSTQIETLLPMEGCVYPYRHVAPAAGAPYRRDALGIAADAVVIGAFVSGLKLSRRCLALWREVLGRLPRARLAFSPVHPAHAALYARIVASAGIAADRIVLVPQGTDDAANQARYALVDFVLDPVPYGGANGTLEALDMNVPVVTLAGRRHGERTSYSMLANLGVTQTIAESGREYVDLAVRLATDAAFMHEVRTAIRDGIAASPLTDMRAHTRHLEAAYREALRKAAPDALAAAEGGSKAP